MKIVLTSLILILSQIAYSQKNETKDLVSVQAFIGGPHPSPFRNSPRDTCYTAIGLVKNNQDTAISFFIMAKSWYVENWITDNDSIYMDFEGWSLNSVTEIKLLPHQSITFTFELIPRKGMPANNTFRLGLLFSDNKFTIREPPMEERIKNSKIYWSNNVTLERNPLNHKIM